jgi:hypothetical protein
MGRGGLSFYRRTDFVMKYQTRRRGFLVRISLIIVLLLSLGGQDKQEPVSFDCGGASI